MKSTSSIVHPAWLRLTHWVNALATVLLVLSGWRIYNASPIFAFNIPDGLTLGGWLGGALLWHFFAMYVLIANGLLYLTLNFLTGRFRRKFFPLSPKAVWADLRAALTLKLQHTDLSSYNALQKLAYLFMIVDLVLLVLSGLAIWKSVQFPLLRELMGGYDMARVVHFVAMSALLLLLAVHLVMVARFPKTLLLMTRGR